LSSYPDRQLWQHIAYVPQARGNAFPLSALDMVMLGRSSHLGVFAQPKEEDRSIALQAMEETDIVSLKDKRCDEMSGGELQMVLIARALAVQPRMLVFDEPESNLDFRNQLVILNTIRDLAESKHLSIIVNTHYPEHALRIADHALLLNKDGTNLYGKVCEVVNELNLRKTFMVQVHINDFVYQEKHYQNVVPLSLL
jgi:iron complex transport system ATP-binding protein